MINISYLDYYLPESYEKAKNLLSEINNEEINSKSLLDFGGLENVAVEYQLSNFEMLDLLMKRYIDSGNEVADIDYIICNGADRVFWEAESIPHEIASKYNINKAAIIPVNQQCSTVSSSMELADALICSNRGKKILMLTFSRAYDVKKRVENVTLLGDGAAIMVLEKKGDVKVIDVCSRSFKRTTNILDMSKLTELQKTNASFYMKTTIEELLRKNNVKLEEIKYIIPQNLNKMLSKLDAKNLGINYENFFVRNISRCGHIGDVDTIINLKDFYDAKLIGLGEKYLLITSGAIGSNLTYVAVLFENN
ncbi:Hypothetical protein CM240_3199 [Clostridium bornimense]|uniref:Uncharacterized protein n=1 Tax=Clostridium bornimense TaxID=1216932 RepID=W6S082_9CLOT|nr:3-oxoacyl-[acyl-carrier-protein] synthase III C-terminal domain-containing protein [Clostridium bornimense]CDM70316.1 Hypothetical protein CM240_3199 [Clostridium bornimense]